MELFGQFRIFALVTLVSQVWSYKILGLFPHFGKSHHDVFEPMLLNLAKRGHEMTIISHFVPKKIPEKWTHISMGSFENLHMGVVDLGAFENIPFGLSKHLHFAEIIMLSGWGKDMCEAMTSLDELKTMIENKEKFDLILIEQFISDCSLGVAYLFDAPIIGMQSHTFMTWTNEKLRQPHNLAYVPNLFSGFSPEMTFLQRVENTLITTIQKVYHRYFVMKNDREIIERNLQQPVPDLGEIAKNISGFISNTHPLLFGVRPVMSNIIEVNGMHLRKTINPLDTELEKFMNKSTEGVILFSMGSMIKMTSLPVYKLKYFLDIFSTLKQRIIWKWEGEVPEGLPKNVYIMKWVPQYDILHHPKTVAFFSHGGLLGTTEGLHAGVPTLFFPVYGDQFTNSAAGEYSGLGVALPFRDLTKEKLESAVHRILSPELQKSASDLSKAWHDRPDPLETATDFVEYIIRHGNRRSAAQNLNLFQLLLLDVILFILVVISLFMYIFYKFVSFVVSRFICRYIEEDDEKLKTT